MNNSRIDIHENLCNELHDLYVSKNEDYGDSFRKVRNMFPTAILIRLHDKLNRLESLLGKDEDERKVKDESIDDTLMDIANYALLELVERHADCEACEEDEDEDEEDDDDLTSSECIKRMSRRSAEWYNKLIRSNTFDHPNYAHYEVFGSFNDDNTARITVVRFDDNGEITGFKEEFRSTHFDKLNVDFSTYLITDPKMLSDNKICYHTIHTIRNAVWNLMGQKRFQWIIAPNDDGISYTFRSYIFDENNDLIKNFVNYSVFMDIDRPMIIMSVKGMFKKEDKDVEED